MYLVVATFLAAWVVGVLAAVGTAVVVWRVGARVVKG